MITDAILGAIFAGLTAIVGLLPSWSLPSLPSPSGAAVYLSSADSLVPLGTIVLIVGASLLLIVLLAGWDLAVFIYHQFWGSA